MALNFIIHLTTFCIFQKSEVFIQTLQKSQDRHKISFAFEFNNKTPKTVFVIAFFGWGRFAPPPPIQLSWIFAKARKQSLQHQGLEEKITDEKIEVQKGVRE